MFLSISCASKSNDKVNDDIPEKKSDEPSKIAIIQGNAWYRERIAIPPNSDLRVSLARYGRFDDPFSVVADRTWAITRNIPIPFALPYEEDLVSDGKAYRLRVQIISNGRVMFETPAPVDVLTGADPDPLNILLTRRN